MLSATYRLSEAAEAVTAIEAIKERVESALDEAKGRFAAHENRFRITTEILRRAAVGPLPGLQRLAQQVLAAMSLAEQPSEQEAIADLLNKNGPAVRADDDTKASAAEAADASAGASSVEAQKAASELLATLQSHGITPDQLQKMLVSKDMSMMTNVIEPAAPATVAAEAAPTYDSSSSVTQPPAPQLNMSSLQPAEAEIDAS